MPVITQDFEPKACGYSLEAISLCAEQVATKLEYLPGGDLSEVVAKLGGKIRLLPASESSTPSRLEVNDDQSFTISIPSAWHPLWQRYAIAHELGHYILHALVGRIKIKAHFSQLPEDQQELVEVEAHEFACSFLVDKKTLSRFTQGTSKKDKLAISAYFSVPSSVIEYRLNALHE